MSIIQQLEQLGASAERQAQLHGDPQLQARAEQAVEQLLQSQGKMWCALFPAEDEPQKEDQEDSKDNEEAQVQ